MKTAIGNIVWFVAFLSLAAAYSACSTGIESTKTITLNKSDLRKLEPSAEEKLAAQIVVTPLKDWEIGRKFVITDNRAYYVFNAYGIEKADTNLKGRQIRFKGVGEKLTPGGTTECVVTFTDGLSDYNYSTGKAREEADTTVNAMNVPMLIDLATVDLANRILSGKNVWAKTQMWYGNDGEKMTGRKFVPVKIMSVVPGNMLFPFRLNIEDENGSPASLYMNLRNTGVESRSFASLFSLSDPKEKYSSIDPEVWKLIQNGKLRLGMTKDECKLSLGNPTTVDSGHDWNATYDIWQYSDGSTLQFQDGLLVHFRH